MVAEWCFGFVCLAPLNTNTPKFFGFSEFLTSLDLMVLAWTTADIRYRFRIQSAPIPLISITFFVVAAVGVLTLLTDLWRVEGWLVPRGILMTSALWQAILGGLFLMTFLTWAWFAFVRPPVFSKRNSIRFAEALYYFVLRGSPNELTVIADELILSVRSLIYFASDRGELKNYHSEYHSQSSRKPHIVEENANKLLLLIADKRFCRAIVKSSPNTMLAIFQEMSKTRKYGI
ncbi:MAG: hypothetical protein KGI13_08310 [Betaproteobacteria bacterium]|nr:hypothetical protein [Betaproteobacteria bacterium]